MSSTNSTNSTNVSDNSSINGNEEPKFELCRCGRLMNRPHCIRCGVLNCYALKEMLESIDSHGKQVFIHAYRCRTCGLFFDENARKHCQAPSKQLTLREERKLETMNLRQEYIRKAEEGYPFGLKKNRNEWARFKRVVGKEYEEWMRDKNLPTIAEMSEEEGYIAIINDTSGAFDDVLKDMAKQKLAEIKLKKGGG